MLRIVTACLLFTSLVGCKKSDDKNEPEYSCSTFTGEQTLVFNDSLNYAIDTLTFRNSSIQTGKGITWDFTNLQTTDSSKSVFINPIGTPADSLYANADIALKGDTLTFIELKTNGVFELNSPSNYKELPYSLPYKNPKKIISFPITQLGTEINAIEILHKKEFVTFNYNNSTISADSVIFKRTGTQTIDINSCGTLQLPGSNHEVFGVKTTEIFTDTVLAYQFIGLGTQEIEVYAKKDTIEYYSFYTDKAKTVYPILSAELKNNLIQTVKVQK